MILLQAFATIFLFLPSQADSTAQEAFTQGNAFYESGAFGEALTAYEAALASGKNPGLLHYNAGNSLFRLGRFGEALYHYECARLYLPRVACIGHNAAITRKRLGLEPERDLAFFWSHLLELIALLTPAEQFTAAGFMGSLAFFLLSAWILNRFRAVLLWLLVSVVLSLALTGIAVLRTTGPSEGVAIAAAPAMSEPGLAPGERRFIVREGEDFKIVESIEGWHRIESEHRIDDRHRVHGGERITGWIQASAIRIYPSY